MKSDQIREISDPLQLPEIRTQIEGVATDGRGIARIDGKAVFVERALPGDDVAVRVDWDSQPPAGQVVQTHTLSKLRVQHPCPHAESCGASPFGALRYSEQLTRKTELVQRTLRKTAGEFEIRQMIASPEPWRYRNRISVRLQHDEDRLRIGYRSEPRSREIVEISGCRLASETVENCLSEFAAVLSASRGNFPERLPVRIQIHDTQSGAGMMLVFAERVTANLRQTWRKWLTAVNIPGGVWFAGGNRAGVIGGRSLIEADQGAEPMVTSWLGKKIRVHPAAFCQANAGAARLASKRLASWARTLDAKAIWDLYGGYGALGFAAASGERQVNIIESSKWCEQTARELAKSAGVDRLRFFHGDVLRMFAKHADEVGDEDLIILDPPRSGAHSEVLRTIAGSSARLIAYLSCNPARLGRDMRILMQDGFRVEEVQPFDFFPQTASTEVLALLTR